jgi:hypothetical protein
MKLKFLKVLLLALMVTVFAACSSDNVATEEENNTNEEVTNEEVTNEGADYSGTFVGYSWKGEAEGITLEEADEKIETELTLDADGVITDAKMLFLKDDGEGNWFTRTDSEADVNVDFSVVPTLTTPENDSQEYAAGESMFEVETADMMSFYAAAVDADGTVALAIVEPYSRHQFEYKMDKDFDFSTKMADLTVGNGLAVPTTRVSTSGFTKPTDWDEYADKSVLGFKVYGAVLTDRGTFEGLSDDSSIQEFLERTGVTFEDGSPIEMELTYGRHSNGGWEGNFKAIEQALIGQNATEKTSLVDWEDSRYSNVNEDNFFGVDGESGATRTVQNSLTIDGISGATIRISRESASYQRALVEAGIIKEEEVIKGRF